MNFIDIKKEQKIKNMFFYNTIANTYESHI